MFTGIVEEVGTVTLFEKQATGGARLRVQCRTVLDDTREGSSIAVNGVCLTAIGLERDSFAADLAPETLLRSNLGDLSAGSLVNLERPLAANGRLSGHIVQGHVDGTGEIVSFEPIGDQNWWLKIRVPNELDRFLVYKGSVAIDGISLTIARLDGDRMEITIIPHTVAATNLSSRKPGARVNIECDILAKHVEKLMSLRSDSEPRP
jgi:riboflavin synthase